MRALKLKIFTVLIGVLFGGILLTAYAADPDIEEPGSSPKSTEQSRNSEKGWVLRDNKWFYYFEDGRQASNEWIKAEYTYNAATQGSLSETDDERRMNNPDYTWKSCSYEDGMFYMYADGGYAKNGYILGEYYLASPDGTQRGGWIRQVIQGHERETPFYSLLYYLDPGSGRAVCYDWLLQDGKWYFFSESGMMVTSGWITWKGKWYYLTASGEMAVSTITHDGYQVDENGVWLGGDSQTSYIIGGLSLDRIPMSRSSRYGDSYGGTFFDPQRNEYYKGWIKLELRDPINGTLYKRTWSHFDHEGELTNNKDYPAE